MAAPVARQGSRRSKGQIDRAQNAFNAGELSKVLRGRYELPKYDAGVEKLLNFSVLPEGGARRRQGTTFVKETKAGATKRSKLIPFVFSTEQAYMLEFGDLYIRVYALEGFVLAPTRTFIDTGVDTAGDTITTVDPHFYVSGEGPFTLLDGGTGLPTPLAEGVEYYIVGVTDNVKFKIDTTPTGPGINISTIGGATPNSIIPKGEVVHELVSPYPETALFGDDRIHFAQSADVLYLVHKDFAPRKLERTGNTEWTLSVIDFIDGPYGSVNLDDGKTLVSSVGTAGSATVVTAVGHAPFLVGRDEGRLVRIKSGANWGYVKLKVDGANTTTAFAGDVVEVVGITAVKDWRLGSWYTGSWPRAVSIFESRLSMGGEQDEPSADHSSMTNRLEEFRPTDKDGSVNDDNAIDVRPGGGEVNAVVALASVRNLVIGTTGAIFPLQASSANEAVTPTNRFAPKAGAGRGSSTVQPVAADDTVVYLSRNKRRVRGTAFDFGRDGYRTNDLTLLARHVAGESRIEELAYKDEPDPIVLALRADGKVYPLTLLPDEEVLAWSQIVVGGSFVDTLLGKTFAAQIESMGVIPSPGETHDQVWLVVKRTINGATVRYIEFVEEDFEEMALADAQFVDCALPYEGVPTTELTGYTHLEGETVQVFGDSHHVGDFVVTGGKVTLTEEVSKAKVGLAYESVLKSLPLVLRVQNQVFGRLGRIAEVVVKLFETIYFEIGSDDTDERYTPQDLFRQAATPMNEGPGLFSGDFPVKFDGTYSRSSVVSVRQKLPLPLTILALDVRGAEGGR